MQKLTVAQWLDEILNRIKVEVSEEIIDTKPFVVWSYELSGLEVTDYLMLYYYTIEMGIKKLESRVPGSGVKTIKAGLDGNYLRVKDLAHEGVAATQAMGLLSLSSFNEMFIETLKERSDFQEELTFDQFIKWIGVVRENMFNDLTKE